jgi:hypothetical protein
MVSAHRMSRGRARGLGRVACLTIGVALVASCEFDKRTVGLGQEQVAVHGVLDPAAFSSTILVEKLLTGRTPVGEGRHDAVDPIVSGGGIPISGARVIITSDIGEVAYAVEDITTRSDGKGAGVYRIQNGNPPTPSDSDWVRLAPAGQYTLRVETPDGTVVTGSTVIPSVQPGVVNPSFVQFNRDRDSVFLQWGEIPLAHRYAVRVESPRGPFLVFVDSLEYLVAGTLRNIFTEGLPSTFVPGFRQVITVGAVDRNFYDYYRSRNDLFTGRGLINHLQGGIGFFGAYVMLRGQTLNVIADTDHPFEAPYTRIAGPASSPLGFTVYLESESTSGVRQLSGSWSLSGVSGANGMIGTLDSRSDVTLALLRGQVATDTVDVLDLRWDGLALIGTLRSTGQLVDYRRAALP